MRAFARMVVAALGAISLAEPAGSGKSAPMEYEVKAVFLYHFTQFVDWPESAFSDPGEALVIGVLGKDPFGEHLDLMVKSEKKAARSIVVRRFRDSKEAEDCHILYLGGLEGAELAGLLSGLKDKPILTVGEIGPFNGAGGMVRFFTDKSRIRLAINLEAVQAAKLTMSSKVLRLAELSPGKG